MVVSLKDASEVVQGVLHRLTQENALENFEALDPKLWLLA